MTSSLPSSTTSTALFSAVTTHAAVRTVYGGRPFHTDGGLYALQFAPDGRLWTFEEGGVLRNWDVVDGRQLQWHLLDGLGTLWAFNASAALLAAGSDDLSIYDVASGQILTALPQSSWINALAFHADTSRVATGHDDGSLRIWDGVAGRLLLELPGHAKAVSAVAFSPDGARLASAGEEKRILLWDLEKQTETGRLFGHTDRIPALAWHPRGHRLYSAGWDTTTRVWDVATLEPIILLNSHNGQVHTLTLSADGELLACSDSANAVHLWKTDNHQTVCVFRENVEEVRCLAFSSDGGTLACGGEERILRVWQGLKSAQPQGASIVRSRSSEETVAATLAVSPDGQRLVGPGDAAALRVWEVETGRLLAPLRGAGVLRAVAWSPDGRRVAAGGEGTPLHLWDIDGDRRLQLEGQSGAVASVAFSSDGKLLASAASQRCDVWLWDVETGQPWLLIPDADDSCAIEAIAFHPTRRLIAAAGMDYLATGGSDGAVAVWDVDARREVALLDGAGAALAFHPAGVLLAVGGPGPSVRIWDFAAAKLVTELAGHEDSVTAIAYSPDGRWLATAGNDRTVRLWDATEGKMRGGLDLDTQAVALAFSPDGTSLFTANANTSCYRLDVAQMLAAH